MKEKDFQFKVKCKAHIFLFYKNNWWDPWIFFYKHANFYAYNYVEAIYEYKVMGPKMITEIKTQLTYLNGRPKR